MSKLSIKLININLPENHPILEHCRPLYEYSWFVQCIREGPEAGRPIGIQALISSYKGLGISYETTPAQIQKKFSLDTAFMSSLICHYACKVWYIFKQMTNEEVPYEQHNRTN